MAGLVRVLGAAQLLKALRTAIAAAQGPQEYWVGSAVGYGAFHEFGTGDTPSRPHWVPSIQVIALKYGLASNQDPFVNMLLAPRGLVKRIAFDLERQVKVQITTQGVLETSNYRGSVAAAESEEAAFALSQSRRIDGGTS